MIYPKIDWTPLIKNDNEKKIRIDSYNGYKIKPDVPDIYDKDNFITWIICGEPYNNADLPEKYRNKK